MTCQEVKMMETCNNGEKVLGEIQQAALEQGKWWLPRGSHSSTYSATREDLK